MSAAAAAEDVAPAAPSPPVVTAATIAIAATDATAAAAAATTATTVNGGGPEKKNPQRVEHNKQQRENEVPIEDIYDLTKPIPKVRHNYYCHVVVRVCARFLSLPPST